LSIAAPVIYPKPTRGLAGASPGPTKDNDPSLGNVIAAFKSLSTITVNRLLSRTGRRLLQEDYFEHVIRNVDSLEKIRGLYPHKPGALAGGPGKPAFEAGRQVGQ
jgi:hypothetical protein